MKMKTKKILAGICIGIAGMGLLAGCSLSDEQMEAVDKLTKNTETLVDSLDRYLESSNSKLDKNTAFDMLREARMKSMYIVGDSEVMSAKMIMTDNFNSTTPKMYGHSIFDYRGDFHKTISILEDGSVSAVEKSTELENVNSYFATYNDYNSITLKEVSAERYMSEINQSIDPFAQLGIYQLTIDEITNVKYENGEYTFNIIKTRIVENNHINDEIVTSKFTYIMNIVVKDYLFKSVTIDAISEHGNENSFLKDTENNLIEDGYGSYIMSGNVDSYNTLQIEYLYGDDVDLTLLNNKIAEIDAKIESGELTFA